MKYATVQFIVMLIFALTIKAEEIHINNYFRLISDAHKYYHTFSIIFVHPDSYYDFDTTTLLYSWSRDFSQQRIMTATITFSDLVSDYNKYQRTIARPLFVVLLDTRETMNEFVKVTKNVKPISFPAWLIMFLQRPGKPLEKYCQQPAGNMFNVDFNTLMLVLCYDHPSLFEWYAIHDNRTRMFELATWTADGSLSFRTQKNLYTRRNDMFGDIVRVASVNSSPLFFLENGAIGGFLGLLLIELSRVMNFTMKVLDPIEEYGSWNEKKKVWTGVIGQLVSGKADIGVSEFSITTNRLNVIDFSLPLMHTPSRIYFKQPSGIDLHWSGYFKAFSLGIWIMLLTIIITASILLSIISTKGCFSMNLIFENYVHIWGIYCQQGLSEFSNKLSMRLAIFSIYISSLIITSAYSASLISFLTLSKTKLPFSNLEGYVKDGSYKLIVMKNSAELDTVHTAKIPVFSKMRGLLEEKHFPLTSSDGFKQICERKNLAFFTTELFKSTSIYMTCEVTYIESGRMDSLALALTKGNPYTHLMNYHLRRFQLNGIINKLKNTHFLTSNLETNFSVVSLRDIIPTLTIVAGGIVLALCILAIEKIYYFFDIRSKKAKDQVNKSDQNIESKNQVMFLANYKSEIMKRT